MVGAWLGLSAAVLLELHDWVWWVKGGRVEGIGMDGRREEAVEGIGAGLVCTGC